MFCLEKDADGKCNLSMLPASWGSQLSFCTQNAKCQDTATLHTSSSCRQLECWTALVNCKEHQHRLPHVVLFILERTGKLCELGRVLIPGELTHWCHRFKRVRELCANWQLNVPFNTNPRDPPLILTDNKVCVAGLRARPPVDRPLSLSHHRPCFTLR